ncbi:cytochrome c [Rhodopseudomonas pseudopalustris]|uniref:c-type cytochrome n=1 Tax=Rhodopseudomonas pseudopalustris TaxID=1513892 RepID=UPI003F9C91DA
MSRSASALRALTASFAALSLLTSVAVAQQQLAIKPGAKLGLGRVALPEEIKAWDTDVRPDGVGLPDGKGTPKLGDAIFQERCSTCHGEFGEGVGRYPVLAGGLGSLKADRPDKTVGSYWSDATTLFDYIKRAMPYGNARSLTDDEIYAVAAYILSMNDVIKDENFELNKNTLAKIKMPNAAGFYEDDRDTTEKHFWNKSPCMSNCRDEPKVIGRAISVDVTPEGKNGPAVD